MDLSRYRPVFGDAASVRFCFLPLPTLEKAITEPRIVDALLVRLDVPGKPAVLKALSHADKLKAIEQQIEHYRRTPSSFWFEVPAPEVLAAALYSADVPDKLITPLFSDVRLESALTKPVIDWLRANSHDAYVEVPLGKNRADALGFKAGGFLSSTSIIAVEAKNDLEQMKRGLDQLATFSEYAHRTYLACTPYLAAQYLDAQASGVKVKHWDPMALHSKLERFGFGLLLVEGTTVTEYVKPKPNEPTEKKLAELKLALDGRPRY